MADRIYLASNNKHKVEEIQHWLGDTWEVAGLDFFGITDIPETGKTLEENSALKAKFLYDIYRVDCFADDSGLEVEALNGEPGVFSARYAGEEKNDKKNTEKLLQELKGKTNRKAQFRTVITLFLDTEKHVFEGIVTGIIATEPKGTNGFGYDPIFIPDGHTKTFAEMTLEEKNQISHRAIAVEKMVALLKEN